METLPDELLLQVFSFIPPDEAFKNAIYVSGTWHELIDSKSMWNIWCTFFDTLVGRIELANHKKHRRTKSKVKDDEHLVSIGAALPKSISLKSTWIQRRRIQHTWEHPLPPRDKKSFTPTKRNTIYSTHYDGTKHVFFGLEPPNTTIEVWDVNAGQSGTHVKSIDVGKHSEDSYVMSFSNSGTAAVVNRDSTNVINVWTNAWDNISGLSYHKLVFSNNILLGACNSHVQSWDATAFRPLHTYEHGTNVGEIAGFGDMFVSQSRNGLSVWDIRSNKRTRALDTMGVRNIMCNGTHIVVTHDISVYSSAVSVIDLREVPRIQPDKNGRVNEWQTLGYIQSIAHCLEGNKFTCSQRGKTQWWDIRTRKEHRDFVLPTPIITGLQTVANRVVCFSPTAAYMYDY